MLYCPFNNLVFLPFLFYHRTHDPVKKLIHGVRLDGTKSEKTRKESSIYLRRTDNFGDRQSQRSRISVYGKIDYMSGYY